MFIPGLIRLMVDIYRYCRGRMRLSWRQWAVRCAVNILLYPLGVMTNSINTAVETVLGTVDEGARENTKELKLFEIIGE